MKDDENIKKLLRHEMAICEKLMKEYRDNSILAVQAGDLDGAQVQDDLCVFMRGRKSGLETALMLLGEDIESK